MKSFFLLCFFAFSIPSWALWAQAIPLDHSLTSESKSDVDSSVSLQGHHIYFEAGGITTYYSLNYEYVYTLPWYGLSVSAALGVSLLPDQGEGERFVNGFVPFQLRVIGPIKKGSGNFWEAGMGLSGYSRRYSRLISLQELWHFEISERRNAHWVMGFAPSIAYRYQVPNQSLYLKVSAYALFNDLRSEPGRYQLNPWLGIALGFKL